MSVCLMGWDLQKNLSSKGQKVSKPLVIKHTAGSNLAATFTCFVVLMIHTHRKFWKRSSRSNQLAATTWSQRLQRDCDGQSFACLKCLFLPLEGRRCYSKCLTKTETFFLLNNTILSVTRSLAQG